MKIIKQNGNHFKPGDPWFKKLSGIPMSPTGKDSRIKYDVNKMAKYNDAIREVN